MIGMNIACYGRFKDGDCPMIELVLIGAAAISIAATASVYNKRRFATAPARMRKRQP